MKVFKFFVLVIILSIPFWVLGAYAADLTEILPVKLPISAIMAMTPLLAAILLTYQEQKAKGVKRFLKQTFDYHKIKDWTWYLPVLLIMPVTLLISFVLMKALNYTIPEIEISILNVLIFSAVYFIGAIGEELGWTGYVTEPLQKRIGALEASILIGIVWSVWHIIPYVQAQQDAQWIFWQCFAMIPMRIIIVWLFYNTNKSVFVTVLFHMMINVSMFSFPNYGSHYDPMITSLILFMIIIFILTFWDTKTFTRFKNI